MVLVLLETVRFRPRRGAGGGGPSGFSIHPSSSAVSGFQGSRGRLPGPRRAASGETRKETCYPPATLPSRPFFRFLGKISWQGENRLDESHPKRSSAVRPTRSSNVGFSIVLLAARQRKGQSQKSSEILISFLIYGNMYGSETDLQGRYGSVADCKAARTPRMRTNSWGAREIARILF